MDHRSSRYAYANANSYGHCYTNRYTNSHSDSYTYGNPSADSASTAADSWAQRVATSSAA